MSSDISSTRENQEDEGKVKQQNEGVVSTSLHSNGESPASIPINASPAMTSSTSRSISPTEKSDSSVPSEQHQLEVANEATREFLESDEYSMKEEDRHGKRRLRIKIPRKKKSKKRKLTDDAPRKPFTSYNFFYLEERVRILDSIPDPSTPDGPGDATVSDKSENISSVSSENGSTSDKGSESDKSDESIDLEKSASEDDVLFAPILQKYEIYGNKKNGNKKKTKRKHRKTHGKMSFITLAKIVGSRWRNLSKHKKSYYQRLAAADKRRYKREMEEHTKIGDQSLTLKDSSDNVQNNSEIAKKTFSVESFDSETFVENLKTHFTVDGVGFDWGMFGNKCCPLPNAVPSKVRFLNQLLYASSSEKVTNGDTRKEDKYETSESDSDDELLNCQALNATSSKSKTDTADISTETSTGDQYTLAQGETSSASTSFASIENTDTIAQNPGPYTLLQRQESEASSSAFFFASIENTDTIAQNPGPYTLLQRQESEASSSASRSTNAVTNGATNGFDVGEIDGLSLLNEDDIDGLANGLDDCDSLLIDGATNEFDVRDIDGLSLLNDLQIENGSEQNLPADNDFLTQVKSVAMQRWLTMNEITAILNDNNPILSISTNRPRSPPTSVTTAMTPETADNAAVASVATETAVNANAAGNAESGKRKRTPRVVFTPAETKAPAKRVTKKATATKAKAPVKKDAVDKPKKVATKAKAPVKKDAVDKPKKAATKAKSPVKKDAVDKPKKTPAKRPAAKKTPAKRPAAKKATVEKVKKAPTKPRKNAKKEEVPKTVETEISPMETENVNATDVQPAIDATPVLPAAVGVA